MLGGRLAGIPASLPPVSQSRVPDGYIIPGVAERSGKPAEWQDIEAGWGQEPGIMHVQWGGPDKEYEVQVVDAPVIVERFDHPNRPSPLRGGGHNQ